MNAHVVGTSGPPLVVLHGGPDFDHQYLLPELDLLARVAHVVTYDSSGRGPQHKTADEEVSLASELDDLDSVRRSVTDGPVALLGHSWGGLLAMAFAADRPTLVSHLVLVNTAPAGYAGWLLLHEELRRRRSASDRAAFTAIDSSDRYRDGDPDADLAHYRVHFRTAFADPTAHLDRLLARLRVGWTADDILRARRIEARLYDETVSAPSFDLLPRLADLPAPILALHGRADLVPVEAVIPIVGAVPDAELAMLEDCGHFCLMEQPTEAVARVTAFLRGDAAS